MGAYWSLGEFSFPSRHEVDRSYVRCLRVLMAGPGYPMLATHDPRMIKITLAQAALTGRPASSYELQMLPGVRHPEQPPLPHPAPALPPFTPSSTPHPAHPL